MSVHVAPPIDFSPIADLRIEPRARKVVARLSRLAGLAGTGGGATALALRWAPPLVAIMRSVRPKRRSNAPWFVAAGAGLVAAGFAGWQLQRLFVAQPEYTVESRVESHQDGLEVRHYGPTRVAETSVDGPWGDALEQGFRRLAGFIFGGNARKQRIAMTAPVTATRQTDGYALAFAMPEGVDLPRPDDERIAIRAVASRRVAVLRFCGPYDDESIEGKKRELTARVAQRGFVPRGEPTFAGYDPPTTIPWLRRNEVWLEIEP
jgi:SOUL heme-binding protein